MKKRFLAVLPTTLGAILILNLGTPVDAASTMNTYNNYTQPTMVGTVLDNQDKNKQQINTNKSVQTPRQIVSNYQQQQITNKNQQSQVEPKTPAQEKVQTMQNEYKPQKAQEVKNTDKVTPVVNNKDVKAATVDQNTKEKRKVALQQDYMNRQNTQVQTYQR